MSMERRQFISKLNSLDLHPYIFVCFIRLYCILMILSTFQLFFFFFTSSCAAPGVLCGRKMNKTHICKSLVLFIIEVFVLLSLNRKYFVRKMIFLELSSMICIGKSLIVKLCRAGSQRGLANLIMELQ